MTRIEDDQQGVIGFWVAIRGKILTCITSQEHTQTARLGFLPMIVTHRTAAWTDPVDIPQAVGLRDLQAVQETCTAKYRMFLPQVDQSAHKIHKFLLFSRNILPV